MCLEYANLNLMGSFDDENTRSLIVTYSIREENCINNDDSETDI